MDQHSGRPRRWDEPKAPGSCLPSPQAATAVHPAAGIHHATLLDRPEQFSNFSWCLPQAYEPGYAYPLLVLLHEHAESERQWLEALGRLSRRNYVGVGLRGPHSLRGTGGRTVYGWGRGRCSQAALEDYVLEAIDEVTSVCNIHPDRIFLAGFGEGATTAIRLGLAIPERFAGIVALDGAAPDSPLPWRHGFRTASPPVLLSYGTDGDPRRAALAEKTSRLLEAAGVPFDLKVFPTGHGLDTPVLRAVDQWLVDRMTAS